MLVVDGDAPTDKEAVALMEIVAESERVGVAENEMDDEEEIEGDRVNDGLMLGEIVTLFVGVMLVDEEVVIDTVTVLEGEVLAVAVDEDVMVDVGDMLMEIVGLGEEVILCVIDVDGDGDNELVELGLTLILAVAVSVFEVEGDAPTDSEAVAENERDELADMEVEMVDDMDREAVWLAEVDIDTLLLGLSVMLAVAV